MQPLIMDLADAIEKKHLESFRGQVIPDVPVFSETEGSKKPGQLWPSVYREQSQLISHLIQYSPALNGPTRRRYAGTR
jgi:hypothetical protein